MTEFLQSSLCTLLGWDWLQIAQTSAAIFVAYIAHSALNTWRQQLKATIRTDFLDKITDAVHAYIATLGAPVTVLRLSKIGIESQAGLPILDKSLPNSEAIAFIESNGKYYSDKILEHLENIREPVAKVRALAIKGQTLGFDKYNKCSEAVKILASQYDRLESFAVMIGSENMNWENPGIQKILDKILSIEPDDIGKDIQKYNVSFLEFISESYASTFGDT